MACGGDGGVQMEFINNLVGRLGGGATQSPEGVPWDRWFVNEVVFNDVLAKEAVMFAHVLQPKTPRRGKMAVMSPTGSRGRGGRGGGCFWRPLSSTTPLSFTLHHGFQPSALYQRERERASEFKKKRDNRQTASGAVRSSPEFPFL